MKNKALLAALLLALSVFGLTPTPAHAATYTSSYSELSLPGRANNDYSVVLSGRIWPAATGRPVSLYTGVAADGSGGSWLMSAHTDGNGRFSFTTTVTSTTRFKFFSAKQIVGANTYSAASTGTFTVEPPVPVSHMSWWSEISTPEYTNQSDQNVELKGRIWPAAAGRPVSLYSGVAPDGSGGSWIASAHTDANGRFSFVTNVSVVTRFKFFSAKQVIGATTYEASTYPVFTVKSLRFWDAFDQTSTAELFDQGRWTVRDPDFDVPNQDDPDPPREFSRGDDRAVEVGGGFLRLKVLRDPENPGKFLNGHIKPKPSAALDFTYGHFEARIKFQWPRGAHSGFWIQSGYGPGQAEFDVVEFFGESQNVHHTVHWNDPRQKRQLVTPGDTDDPWWNNYHTFEGYWSPQGYFVAIDGKYIQNADGTMKSIPTDGYVGTTPSEVILSLLVNDGEVDYLNDMYGPEVTDMYNHVMTVDWIRVWR